jgi:hypothetical protein
MTTNTLTAPNIPLASKAPGDVDSWGLDWTSWLAAGDYITSVVCALCAGDTSGVTLSASAYTATTSYCAVSGGTVGQTAKVEHTIQTYLAAKRTRTIEIPIVPEC